MRYQPIIWSNEATFMKRKQRYSWRLRIRCFVLRKRYYKDRLYTSLTHYRRDRRKKKSLTKNTFAVCEYIEEPVKQICQNIQNDNSIDFINCQNCRYWKIVSTTLNIDKQTNNKLLSVPEMTKIKKNKIKPSNNLSQFYQKNIHNLEYRGRIISTRRYYVRGISTYLLTLPTL